MENYKHYQLTIRATEETAQKIKEHFQEANNSHFANYGINSFSKEYGHILSLNNNVILKEDDNLILNIQDIKECDENEREQEYLKHYTDLVSKSKARYYDKENNIEWIALYNSEMGTYKILYVEHYKSTNRKMIATAIESTKDKDILSDYGLEV